MRVIATIDGDLSISQSAHHWDFFPNLEKRLICCFTDIKKVALCDQIPHHSFRNANSRLSVESEDILNDWAVGVKLNCKSFHYKLFIGFNNLSKLTLLIVINIHAKRRCAVNVRKNKSYAIF